MKFVLASGSPRRRELLASLGISFTVIKSDIDETQGADEPPYAYVRRLSVEKAQAVAAELDGMAIVLAADTSVIIADAADTPDGGEILGKPADAVEARAMLLRLRGRDHVVCTAITLLKVGEPREMITELTRTTVTMRDYRDDEVEAYISTGDPFDKAGGYAIQHETFHPAARIDGSYSNVVGLPVETLRRMLVELRDPGLQFQMPMDEFLLLPETNLPTELIDGVVYARGANTSIHQRALGNALFLLDQMVEGGMLLPGPIGLHLDGGNFLEPDIVWVSPERAEIIQSGLLHGAPDLIVEVLSPSTALRDKRTKFRLYERCGVREYWMIDPAAQYVEVWQSAGDKFVLLGVFGADETFTSAALGQKEVAVAPMFGA